MAKCLVFLALPVPYLRFLAGLLLSRLGDSLYTFAIPWISYELTGSALVMGSLYAVTVLPIVLFGPIVGVLVDHWERRRLMIATDVLRAALVALVPLLHLLGLLQLWHLYAVSFVLTVLSLLFDVATVAAIPHMAGQDLTRANAGYQIVRQAAELAGPVVAGVVLAAVGGYQTLWLDALSFAGTLLAVLGIPALGQTATVGSVRQVWQGMKDGFRFLVRDRLNFTLSLQAMVGNFGYSMAAGVLMFYLLETLGLNSTQASYNYALIGAGGLLGGFVVVPLARRFRRGVLIPALLGFGTLGFLFAVVSPFWLAPGLAFAAVALCNTAWNTLVTSVRQESVPADMLGRMLGFSRVFSRLAMPLGAMAGAFLSETMSPVIVFVAAAAAKGVEVLIALLSPMRKL